MSEPSRACLGPRGDPPCSGHTTLQGVRSTGLRSTDGAGDSIANVSALFKDSSMPRAAVQVDGTILWCLSRRPGSNAAFMRLSNAALNAAALYFRRCYELYRSSQFGTSRGASPAMLVDSALRDVSAVKSAAAGASAVVSRPAVEPAACMVH